MARDRRRTSKSAADKSRYVRDRAGTKVPGPDCEFEKFQKSKAKQNPVLAKGVAQRWSDGREGGAIDHIQKAQKRKRSEEKTIFDSVEEATDSNDEGATRIDESAQPDNDFLKVEKDSDSKAVRQSQR